MGLYERIKKVASEKGKSINRMEKDLGFARSSISKFNANIPSIDKVQEVANYLNVSVDYLLNEKEWEPTITERDERDIKNIIEALKSKLSTEQGLMYDGEPMDEESQQNVLAAIEVAERTAILEAKRRFTPDKYKK